MLAFSQPPVWQNREWAIYRFRQHENPALLQQIGRLREQTFRAIGEGTGNEIDADRYDAFYQQFVLVRPTDGYIGGAFRAAVCSPPPPCGLYTAELYRYPPHFFETLRPCAEVGRMFLRPECRNASGLSLTLWQALGLWGQTLPAFRYLIGTVSLSPRLKPESQAQIVAFLRQHTARRWPPAPPQTPLPPLPPVDRPAAALPELAARLAAAEDQLPPALKLFWTLGARPLQFTTDPAFGGSLDVLMVLDYTRIPPALLRP